MEVRFFRTPAAFRKWLQANHSKAGELRLGLYKKDTGKGGITYKEALDEALCFGWIDGITHRLNDESYSIRFTPRKPKSVWSLVNIKRMEELIALGRVEPTGLAEYNKRDPELTKQYSYEEAERRLDEPSLAKLKANTKAFEFFQRQAASYRRTASWWVISAKRAETRERRLALLIEHSEKGERLPQFG